MILNEKFIEEIKLLNSLDFISFIYFGNNLHIIYLAYEKTLNYAIETITKENSLLEKFHGIIKKNFYS